ncbi:MAG: hypothetical protein ACO2ZM_03990 [Francisellaceae bacterium]
MDNVNIKSDGNSSQNKKNYQKPVMRCEEIKVATQLAGGAGGDLFAQSLLS